MTVTWWLGRGPNPDDFQRNFVEPFRAAVPEVDLRVEYLGADSQERTLAALADGTAPDIVMIPRAGTFAQLTREGKLADLTGYKWTRRVLPVARQMGTRGGRLYGLPRSSETMLLLYDTTVFSAHGWRPPTTLTELEDLAAAMLAKGIVPFGVGSADVPASVELYFSLAVNHAAGPAYVKEALLGKLSWTAEPFRRAIETLRSWFDRGWFGDTFFTDGYAAGFARLADGEAGMSPNMTWVFGDIPEAFGDRAADVGVAPFPTLRDDIPTPLYIFGTGSLIGITASSPDPGAAATVLEKIFTNFVRRDFSRDLPGDWNLPLTDPDADGLAASTTPQFAATAVALTEAVLDDRYGYSTWSFFPPRTEQAVIDGFRDLIEGRLTTEAYLTTLDDAFHRDRAEGNLVELLGDAKLPE